MDVVFYEAFEEEVDALRRHLPANWQAQFTWQTIQETAAAAPPSRLISIRTQSVVPPAWGPRLEGILSRTTGCDHLAKLAGKVRCGYLPEYCQRAVAEQAILLVLALLRRLPDQLRHFARFNRDGLTGAECAGKKLLVVGVGRIGSEIARLARGLDFQVRGVDLEHKHGFVDYTTIDEGMAWAEIVVCAMNLTAENHGFFGHDRLKQAARGLLFVNIARGEQAPTAALLELLDQGHLGGVALDVFEEESRLAVALRAGETRWPLASRPNVILTPHNAFNTREAVERKARQSVEELVRFRQSGGFQWPVA